MRRSGKRRPVGGGLIVVVTRVSAKFWLAEPGALGPGAAECIPVFHRWIQESAVDGLLIDVADYGHVPDGPGVILIGHEGDHALDLHGGPGFRYEGKRGSGEPADQIADALRRAMAGAALIEADPALGGARFDPVRVRIAIADRLHAPNDDASLSQLAPALADAVGRTFPGQELSAVERVGDGRRPFTADLQFASPLTFVPAEVGPRG